MEKAVENETETETEKYFTTEITLTFLCWGKVPSLYVLCLNKYSKISNSWIGLGSNQVVTKYSIWSKILNIHTALLWTSYNDLIMSYDVQGLTSVNSTSCRPLHMGSITWPVYNGLVITAFWYPWSLFVCSLYNFYGAVMQINSCYPPKLIIAHVEAKMSHDM